MEDGAPRREFERRTVLLATAGAALGLGAMPWLAACSDSSDPSSAAPPLGPVKDDEMMEWIAEIVEQGVRRPAYPADRWIEGWARDQFERAGLEDVRFEDVELLTWEPGPGELVLEPEGHRFTGFPMPYTTAGSVDGELVTLADDDAAGSLAGRIAFSEFTPITLPQTLTRSWAASVHDPDNEFDTLEQTLPFDARFNGVLDPVLETGAAAYVGLLTGFPWETRDYYVPYDAKERAITALWLSGNDGRAVLDLVAQGATRGRVVVEGESRRATSRNVIGTLPGASDDWVIIASHHDGPWASAVEDASGVSLVLAQARHWASVDERDRPHNLLFLLTAGHMADGAGTRAFVEENPDLLERVVLEIHLEHVARECVGQDGELVPTEQPEIRWWFTSPNPTLQQSVQTAIAGEDLRRSLVLPPDVFFENPPTDGAAFHAAGVPVVHFLTAPMYLFDSRDTIDKIHEPSLEPLTRAVIEIVEATRGEAPGAMRRMAAAPD